MEIIKLTITDKITATAKVELTGTAKCQIAMFANEDKSSRTAIPYAMVANLMAADSCTEEEAFTKLGIVNEITDEV